ncbi:MAG: hypothetical protein EBV21_13255, partial [Betaproteobacteria bacterium]|nr:hypothetical protein [Betaproteobacteria bacterium]
MFWVNTSSDNNLSQADRRFVVTYIDALGNLSEPSTLDFSVDTQAPTTLSGVTIMPIGDVVVADTLNSTTTSMAFRATIEKGQATNGRADFYVGNTLMGTVASIGASDETVTLNLNTPTTAALQSKIPAGGLVSVKLYDQAGNMTSATGNVLQYDITVPTVVRITSSTQDGGYKAGSKIQLRLEASEDMTEGSSLVLTLNTGHDASGVNPAVANQQVTLTRDGSIGTLFLGEYTVADGDTSADLAVVDIAAGSIVPHDAAGNALNIGLSGLAAEATLAGSKNIVIDTTAPVLNSVTLSAQRGIVDLASGSDLRAGDTVTVTATYDDTVFGSPTTAPTLSIGNETGITLTAGTTSGNTRTWTYTLSDSGITDTGSISVGGSLT